MATPRKPKEDHKKAGRPTDYKADYDKQVEKLCLLGATDVEIADFFGVAVSTLTKWTHEHPGFSAAKKSGKDAADERVERSLYNRAVGYTFESEKVFQFQGQIVRTPIKEHVPPDTTAGIFWLKNRRSAAWRDVQKHEHGGVGDFDLVDDETLAAETKKEMVALGLVNPRAGASTTH